VDAGPHFFVRVMPLLCARLISCVSAVAAGRPAMTGFGRMALIRPHCAAIALLIKRMRSPHPTTTLPNQSSSASASGSRGRAARESRRVQARSERDPPHQHPTTMRRHQGPQRVALWTCEIMLVSTRELMARCLISAALERRTGKPHFRAWTGAAALTATRPVLTRGTRRPLRPIVAAARSGHRQCTHRSKPLAGPVP
jgi:hypothetical protein